MRVGLALEKRTSLLERARHELQAPVGGIAAGGVAGHEVAFDGVQHVPQVRGVRSVMTLREPQAQRLARSLHEVHELVRFQQRDERVQQAEQVAVQQPDQRGSTRCHRRDIARSVDAIVRQRAARFEDDDLDIIECAQSRLHARTHTRPVQSAQPAAERWDGDRPDPARADFPGERLQPGLDVFEPALATPVPLGREVDDVARGNHRTCLEDEHVPGSHLVALAPGGVRLEVLGKRALEAHEYDRLPVREAPAAAP